MKIEHTGGFIKRMKGHRKVFREHKCICGEDMLSCPLFPSRWACRKELEYIQFKKKKRPITGSGSGP
jgi:hypothetical protein